jgi:hypothetical protein
MNVQCFIYLINGTNISGLDCSEIKVDLTNKSHKCLWAKYAIIAEYSIDSQEALQATKSCFMKTVVPL